MTQSYKALALLLTYPSADLQVAADEMKVLLREERRIPNRIQAALVKLCDEIRDSDLYELQERYVHLFDRTRSLSLNLYEHVHGESRERGPAMVDLIELYKSKGLELSSGELPDALPVFLEFISTLPAQEAHSLLGEAAHVIEALGERLKKRQSAYRAVFGALTAIAGAKANKDALNDILSEPDDDPDDLEAMDKAWEDAPVTFGPESAGDDGCPRAAALVQNMRQGS